MPRPIAIGSWKVAEVALVLRHTQRVLVAGRLDPRVVERRDPQAYLAFLAPSTRPLAARAISQGEPGLGYVTRLGPGYRLDPKGPRVSGRMSVAAGKDGQLVVTADFTWVYPLIYPPGSIRLGMLVPGGRLVVLRAVETFEWYPATAVSPPERGLRPGGGTSSASNIDCTLIRRGLLGLPPPGQGSC